MKSAPATPELHPWSPAAPATHRVLITGGPGVGKTTLLSELGARGYATVAESARAIISERRARGQSPRPEPMEFAQEILRRDTEKYHLHSSESGWVFFDRGLVEALGMVHEVAPLSAHELGAALRTHPFHPCVFILPPWPDIYTKDEERDHSFPWVERVHGALVRWYGSCGYVLHEVPRVSVGARAEFVLRTLTHGAV
ncbi:MAG TPA: AAA family ATPase [Burkholderiaceae bacterium]|nr:AAA family ATPase [Burkholderiaceae bacterium]